MITLHQARGGYIAEVSVPGREFVYRSQPFPAISDARSAAKAWDHWYENVSSGIVESIYYIVAVPETWAGPPAGSHPYSGLRAKIGRSKNPMERLRNLRTGTPDRLVLHALEPGSPEIERQRHQQFRAERRQGEWFVCSPTLSTHILEIWRDNNALPPTHQTEVGMLIERIDAYRTMRHTLGGTPDQVNPSLDEPWRGKVMLDLYYPNLHPAPPEQQ